MRLLDMLTTRKKMSDRELYKRLKKLKLFSTFYLACGQAWYSPIYSTPRTHLRDYLDQTAKRLMEDDEAEYVNRIKNEWNLMPDVKMI